MDEISIAIRLSQPFPADCIEWRIQSSGLTRDGKPWARALAYVSARAVQERFDEVFGIFNWFPEYVHLQNGVMCKLYARQSVEHGWVCKEDGAAETQFEAFKGGISGAFKRAAVLWGVGRYLYKLDAPMVRFTSNKSDNYVKIENKPFYWETPILPVWALPLETGEGLAASPIISTSLTQVSPSSLKALYKLAKDAGITASVMRPYLKNTFGVEKSSDLSQEQASQLVKAIKKGDLCPAQNAGELAN